MSLVPLLALFAGGAVSFAAYRAGVARGRRRADEESALAPPAAAGIANTATTAATTAATTEATTGDASATASSQAAENAWLRALARERRALFRALADAKGETARYRQLVVDLENDAPSRLLDGPGSPDDLKLIVGVGPVLERMLHQLGVTRYRQIARWTERDVDDYERRLPEFPGRIRRDAWVMQARALHHGKYGAKP